MEMSEKRIRVEQDKLAWQKKMDVLTLQLNSGDHFAGMIKDLDDLKDSGFLSEEEYKKQKLDIFKMKVDITKSLYDLNK